MYKAQSINQNPLPDCRSLGVVLRTVLLANLLGLASALVRAHDWYEVLSLFLSHAALLEPVLLTSLLSLAAAQQFLARQAYWRGAAWVVVLVLGITLALYEFGGSLYAEALGNTGFQRLRVAILSILTSSLILGYFLLRGLALSPALHSARLQALQARIRPHFLFNSINAVLGIVRSNPKQAETALEDMSDLFRSAMADDHALVSLHNEIKLTRQYLALETLRLGERLRIDWHIDPAVQDAKIPPMILQPLLENAVYHGIEPLVEGGTIDVRLEHIGNELHLDVRNPKSPQGAHHKGNKMALSNIRERLSLQFDVEARYKVEATEQAYCVHIYIPYLRSSR